MTVRSTSGVNSKPRFCGKEEGECGPDVSRRPRRSGRSRLASRMTPRKMELVQVSRLPNVRGVGGVFQVTKPFAASVQIFSCAELVPISARAARSTLCGQLQHRAGARPLARAPYGSTSLSNLARKALRAAAVYSRGFRWAAEPKPPILPRRERSEGVTVDSSLGSTGVNLQPGRKGH